MGDSQAVHILGQEILVLPSMPMQGEQAYWRVVEDHDYGELDTENRYLRGPKWNNYSCALDTMMVVALLLDAGRCRADQVWAGFFEEKDAAKKRCARLFRDVMQKPWGLLEQEDIDALRDAIMHQLDDDYADLHLEPRGEENSPHSILETIGRGMPQLWHTWARQVRCCERGRWHWTLNKGKIHYHQLLGLPEATLAQLRDILSVKEQRMTVEQAVQHIIDVQKGPRSGDDWEGFQECGTCGGTSWLSRRVILDRPPPTLVLNGFTAETRAGRIKLGDLPGMFDDLNLSFPVYDDKDVMREESATYRLWACVLYGTGRHYLVCMNAGARNDESNCTVYDGIDFQGSVLSGPRSIQAYVEGSGLKVTIPIYVRINK
jgi:hypothetical protein